MSKSITALLNELNHVRQYVRPGQVFYHWKNPATIYKVKELVIDSESEQVNIVYQSINNPLTNSITWTRSFKSWNETIDSNTKRFKEFKN